MIFLTRLNRSSFVVNSDLIEHIEATPDTVIALTSGEKLIVLETADEIIARTVEFRRSILMGLQVGSWDNGRGYLQHCDRALSNGAS